MKRIKLILIAISCLMSLTFSSEAQHFLSTKGRAIVNENQDTVLLRGMGLGGWMVQEGYMLQTAGFAGAQHQIRATIESLIGKEDTDLFYDAWLANHCRKSDIDSLKSWGFNSVRLPMHYNLFTLPIEEEPLAGEQTWLEKGFVLTDSLISWCAQNEMYVILDLHAAPGGQGYDQGISDYDPSKPSLWESQANRNKMVALWKRLAERYADEQWVAGYDLLNEPNWDLPNGTGLRVLYQEITTEIRSVDTRHIIFIEGNWFANDFTGLTPPWDANLVYSPHKYWSENEVKDMQWVLDLQNTHNVPLYLGESGENSNVWFRDAIHLFEDLGIGWAWWPMKKVESISGPLSVLKRPGYQALLDYWGGWSSTPPSVEDAKAALMQLTEDLKTENCVFQKDVIDAMMRQTQSDETIPFQHHEIPGIVYAVDYDMGVIGESYYDPISATYQVTTGEYTPWNNGWAYRNDGVDIEPTEDSLNTNGYNIGWIDAGEWAQYELDIAESGVYEVHVRAASGGSGGRLHFEMDGASITAPNFLPPSGGWQTWQTTVIPNVILNSTDKKFRFFVDNAGFNLSSFEFVKTDLETTDIATEFTSALTLDEYSIQMDANKFLDINSALLDGSFDITVDGTSIPITAINFDTNNPRSINFTVDYILKSTETIKISYSGNEVNASDGTPLTNFTLENVRNTLDFVHQIPGRIQAEAFASQSGIALEETTDTGGGSNIAFLDNGDYLDYPINVTAAGVYQVNFRTASQGSTGGVQLQLFDAVGNQTFVGNAVFPSTGDWQNWATTSKEMAFPIGRYTLRVLITQSPFNMNWMEFDFLTSVASPIGEAVTDFKVFPNPSADFIHIQAATSIPQIATLELYNHNGQLLQSNPLGKINRIDEQFSLADYANGAYWVLVRLENGVLVSEKVVKVE